MRKIIVSDISAVPPATVGAEAGLLLALGITYWLMHERDNGLEPPSVDR
jgi:hypothetical protein